MSGTLWLARAGFRRARRLLIETGARAAQGLSLLERRDHVLSERPGAVPLARETAAVFCHFDPEGRVRAHTRRYVEALNEAGAAVVFVTNSGRLGEEDAVWLRERTAHVIVRRNVGYDFAAWRDGLARAELPQPETRMLLVANDSVYGPFRPLGPILDRMDFGRADVWGLTDSWQHRFHLQSYFLAFGPRALRSKAFTTFWSGVRDIRSKWGVIGAYEVGMTQRLLSGGLRCRAVWPYNMLLALARERFLETSEAERAEIWDPFVATERANLERILRAAVTRQPLNPTSELWRVLLDCGFPFVKCELLRENPARIADVAAWQAVADAIPGFDVEVVLADLERSLRSRSP